MNAAFFKTSMLLHVAKKELSWVNPMGLCHAISVAKHSFFTHMGERNEHVVNAANELEELITHRLHPFAYAHSWLGWKMTYPQYKLKDLEKWPSRVWDRACDWGNDVRNNNPMGLQAWRHAWLDKLIAEFEAKGD